MPGGDITAKPTARGYVVPNRFKPSLAWRRMAAVVDSRGPTRPTTSHMPFFGRTVAEVIADEEGRG